MKTIFYLCKRNNEEVDELIVFKVFKKNKCYNNDGRIQKKDPAEEC